MCWIKRYFTLNLYSRCYIKTSLKYTVINVTISMKVIYAICYGNK